MNDRSRTKQELIHDLNVLCDQMKNVEQDIAAWKRLRDALRESESRLKEAQQVAHIGYWEWLLESGDLFWSDEKYRIFGLSRDTIPSLQAFFDAVHPADLPLVKNSIEKTLQGKRPYNIDIRLIRPDRSERTVNARGRVEYDQSGKPARMFGTVLDITERKQAEEKFRNIFNAANDGILIVDNTTKTIIEANTTICKMLGYTREEMGGLGIQDIHPKKEIARILEEFEKQRRGEITLSPDIPILRKDGSVFYADISTTSMTLKGAKCSIGVFRDITERKQSEEALKNSEKFIRSILNTVDEGFIVVDRDYRILAANKAYSVQVGETSEELIGRHCYDVSHKSKQPCHELGAECPVRYAFDTGEPYAAVHRHTDVNDVVLYVETKAFPIKDDSGAVTSVIEVVNNITEKYLLEEVRLKTQKLEAIGTLAGGIAHDFNNLLQGVFGYVYMAKTVLGDKEASLSMLQQAEQALQQCVNLTKQLLTFSKGGMPVKKLIPIGSLIENSARFALSGSRAECRVTLDPDLWPVEADEGQIGQVIRNIVLNADQAMPNGGTVMINVRNVRLPKKDGFNLLEEGNYVEIAIEDTGTGIAEQYMRKIFDPYFTTRPRRSGLGLATSYSIVKNHGGMINVVSEVNKGTTFFVYLPAVEPETQSPPAVPAVSGTMRKGKILVMDDEELIRRIAGEMLKACGHDVEWAKHGEEAISKYQAAKAAGSPFDVVIVDLTIKGGLGGKETIARLREIDPAVKAIVSSGYSDDTVLSDFSQYGYKARLAKPYKFEELRDTVNKLLS